MNLRRILQKATLVLALLGILPLGALSARADIIQTAEQILAGTALAATIAFNKLVNALQYAAATVVTNFNPDLGDYNGWDAYWNLYFPRGGDRPLDRNDFSYSYAPGAVAGGGTAPFNRGLYYAWQKIQPSASTGATCSDGSPYKFFVNLTPHSSNILFIMEPGGVCFDYGGCTGIRKDGGHAGLGAFNPRGIPDNYMTIFSSGSGSGITESPLNTRLPLLTTTRFKPQNWNIIYLPYCSGDVHIGDNKISFARPANQTMVYDASGNLITPEYRLQYYAGLKNVLSAIGWMRNTLPQPGQIMNFGMSAGSSAVATLRPVIHHFMQPKAMFNLMDSGAIMSAPRAANDSSQYPSTNAHYALMTTMLNYDPARPEAVTPIKFLQELLEDFDVSNLGSVNTAYAKKYPNDRSLNVDSFQDLNYSSFSYQFHPQMRATALAENNHGAPLGFFSSQAKLTNYYYNIDLRGLREMIQPLNANSGYFQPSGRRMNQSHCMLAGTYEGVVNSETGHTIVDAVNNLLDPTVAVFREYESNASTGLNLPLGPTISILSVLMPDMVTDIVGSPPDSSYTPPSGAIAGTIKGLAGQVLMPQADGQVIAADDQNTVAQQWLYDGKGGLSSWSGNCMAANAAAAGSSVGVKQCQAQAGLQSWYLDREGVLHLANSKVLSKPTGANNVVLDYYNGASNQLWQMH